MTSELIPYWQLAQWAILMPIINNQSSMNKHETNQPELVDNRILFLR